jgi:dTMP kinase
VESIEGRGLFITLEGSDGAGKSVQSRLLVERIAGLGHEVVLTREPGGTELGEEIRQILLTSPAEAHDAVSDAFLFNAARAQLVQRVIQPALHGGAVVVCDRFADSTLAYQGYGGGLPLDALRQLAKISTRGLTPDRTVLLDLPTEVGLARRQGGAAAELTRFETAPGHDEQFHSRVRAGFLELAGQEPNRWRVVDATASPDEVGEAVWSAVGDLLEG